VPFPDSLDKVEHFEIPADDQNRALKFYMTVFGWELNPIPGVNYTRLLTKRVSDRDVSPRPFEVNGAIVKRARKRIRQWLPLALTTWRPR